MPLLLVGGGPGGNSRGAPVILLGGNSQGGHGGYSHGAPVIVLGRNSQGGSGGYSQVVPGMIHQGGSGRNSQGVPGMINGPPRCLHPRCRKFCSPYRLKHGGNLLEMCNEHIELNPHHFDMRKCCNTCGERGVLRAYRESDQTQRSCNLCVNHLRL